MDLFTGFEFLIGLVILLASGYWLVPASVSFATHIRIPARLIASLIIAGGTSAPELLVSLDAGLSNNPDISWGNIIGSNIANILLVGGIGMLIYPIQIDPMRDRKEVYILSATSVAVSVVLYFNLDTGAERYLAAIALIAVFLFYARSQPQSPHPDNLPDAQPALGADASPAPSSDIEIADELKPRFAPLSAAILTLATIAGLVIGADYMVQSAVKMAEQLQIEQAVIGISIVAIGTSLPEITAVVASLLNKRSDMAIGNIIGSNMFNIAIVLSLTLFATALPASDALIGANLGFFLFSIAALAVLVSAKKTLGVFTGAGFILTYGLFLLVEFTR